MKDFNLHFGGHSENLGKVIEIAKKFMAELEAEGVEFVHSHFSSGHLLGGSRHDISNIDENTPVVFADGTAHPEPATPVEEAPVEESVVPPAVGESHDSNV